MFYPRHLSRFLLSLLVMLIFVVRVEAQSIPLPGEVPRAGTNIPPGVKARSKTTWRPKGSVVPAQVEEPVDEPAKLPETAAQPTLAPPLEEPAGEMQTLRAPANAAEQTAESGWQVESEPRPARPLPPRANPLRQAGRPQASYQAQLQPTQRNPIQRAQNPVELEVDPEPIPRVITPRMLQDLPGPQTRQQPREAWQVAPGQKYLPPQPSRGDRGSSDREYLQQFSSSSQERHDWPADIQNPTAGPREPEQYADGPHPDEQIPGEELYGIPRVHETNAYGRFSGRGEPLTAGSWLNRPYYVGGFIGGLGGDTLVENEIKANGGFFWGGNLGWDYDPYWGMEMRLAFSSQGLDYLTNAFIDNQYNDLMLWDTSLLYYPWGDARWRPYFKLGFGFADFDYTDAIGFRRSEMVYEMPVGFGMKYRVNQYWTWRFDVTDNLIFGGNAGMATMNQFSLAGGLEYRFGGRRQSYWPWNPSRRWR